ncbi:MAG: aminotransferase class I/II-fold pyridoxal phosphate-dependent enzyme [Reinekea sp.]|jgi:aspartate/methionine/tyrosine aminotransferase
MTLANRTEAITPFYVVQVLKEATELQRQGRDVISLFVGEPDFATPEAIIQQGLKSLATEPQVYISSTGLPELKELIAQRYQRWHGLNIPPERILVTPGGSAALQVAFLATLNPGDDVLLPEPGYPCNANLLAMVNARTVSVHLDADCGMALTVEQLQAHKTGSSRGLLIASPSNPLGSVMSREKWREVSHFCQANGMHLFADEIYHGLSFDGLAPTALEVNNDAWVIQSFSKFYGMTGWRLGWLVVPEYAIDACERIAQNLYLSSSAIAQQAALACFKPEVEAECFARCDELKARRDYLVQALPALGLPVMANPDGAFYLYVDVSRYSSDAQAFCADLLYKTGVAITPGVDFSGPVAATSVRIAYTVNIERLREAVARLKSYLDDALAC